MQTQVTFHCFNGGDERSAAVRTISGPVEDFQKNLDTVLASDNVDKFYCSYTEGVQEGPEFQPLTPSVRDVVVFIAGQGDEAPVGSDDVKEADSAYRLGNRVKTRLGNSITYNGTMNYVINQEKKIIVSPSILYDDMFSKDTEAAAMFAMIAGFPSFMQTEQEKKFDGFFRKHLIPA